MTLSPAVSTDLAVCYYKREIRAKQVTRMDGDPKGHFVSRKSANANGNAGVENGTYSLCIEGTS